MYKIKVLSIIAAAAITVGCSTTPIEEKEITYEKYSEIKKFNHVYDDLDYFGHYEGWNVERVDFFTINVTLPTDRTYFEMQSKTPTSEINKFVKGLANVVEDYDNLEVTVNGYSENTGNKGINDILSEQRAQHVAKMLVKEGLDPDYVLYDYWGGRMNINNNLTTDNRNENRRVEFLITPIIYPR